MTMTAQAAKTKEDVIKLVEKNNVKFIRLWFTDILGQIKSFAITSEELHGAFDEGMGFDGSSIKGYARIDESDMIAKPDPATFQFIPWRPKEKAVARMFCDILNPDGSPYEGDPRYALKRNLDRLKEHGYTFYLGPELEFFYFKNSQGTEVLDNGGYFDLTTLDAASDLRRETVLTLEAMGIKVEYSHHEVAPSQHEIDLTEDGRQCYDLPGRGERSGDDIRVLCHVYAQADVRAEWKRHAYAPVTFQGEHKCLLRCE
jgi:glutamine synthetase